jgi:hypothetical protein
MVTPLPVMVEVGEPAVVGAAATVVGVNADAGRVVTGSVAGLIVETDPRPIAGVVVAEAPVLGVPWPPEPAEAKRRTARNTAVRAPTAATHRWIRRVTPGAGDEKSTAVGTGGERTTSVAA